MHCQCGSLNEFLSAFVTFIRPAPTLGYTKRASITSIPNVFVLHEKWSQHVFIKVKLYHDELNPTCGQKSYDRWCT